MGFFPAFTPLAKAAAKILVDYCRAYPEIAWPVLSEAMKETTLEAMEECSDKRQVVVKTEALDELESINKAETINLKSSQNVSDGKFHQLLIEFGSIYN